MVKQRCFVRQPTQLGKHSIGSIFFGCDLFPGSHEFWRKPNAVARVLWLFKSPKKPCNCKAPESRGMHHKNKAASWLSVDALGFTTKSCQSICSLLDDYVISKKSFYWIGKLRLHQFANLSLAWANGIPKPSLYRATSNIAGLSHHRSSCLFVGSERTWPGLKASVLPQCVGSI